MDEPRSACCVGVDVSKDRLDVHLRPAGNYGLAPLVSLFGAKGRFFVPACILPSRRAQRRSRRAAGSRRRRHKAVLTAASTARP